MFDGGVDAGAVGGDVIDAEGVAVGGEAGGDRETASVGVSDLVESCGDGCWWRRIELTSRDCFLLRWPFGVWGLRLRPYFNTFKKAAEDEKKFETPERDE